MHGDKQGRGGDQARVLVIDDNPDIQDIVVLALADEPYEVVTADHGAAALEVLGQWRPDVILLDLEMPVIDGSEFARIYRQTPGPHAPIVILSAAVDARAKARELGAAATLPKPFDLDELLEMVARLARGRAHDQSEQTASR
jgi:CheY-like chemotaxis protein